MPRCPLPIGEKRLSILVEYCEGPLVRASFSSGNSGVRCSKAIRSRISSVVLPLTELTLSKAKYFSPGSGART